MANYLEEYEARREKLREQRRKGNKLGQDLKSLTIAERMALFREQRGDTVITPDLSLKRLGGAAVEELKTGVRDRLRGMGLVAAGKDKQFDEIRQEAQEYAVQTGIGPSEVDLEKTKYKNLAADLLAASASDILKADPNFQVTSGWIENQIRTITQMGTQLLMGILGGAPTAITDMGALILGGTYDRIKKDEEFEIQAAAARGVPYRRLDEERILNAALINAASQSPMEYIGLFAKKVPGLSKALQGIDKLTKKQQAKIKKQVMKKMLGAIAWMGQRFGPEFATEYIQDMTSEQFSQLWAKNPTVEATKQWGQKLMHLETHMDALEGATHAGVAAIILGGGTALPQETAKTIRGRAAKVIDKEMADKGREEAEAQEVGEDDPLRDLVGSKEYEQALKDSIRAAEQEKAAMKEAKKRAEGGLLPKTDLQTMAELATESKKKAEQPGSSKISDVIAKNKEVEKTLATITKGIKEKQAQLDKLIQDQKDITVQETDVLTPAEKREGKRKATRRKQKEKQTAQRKATVAKEEELATEQDIKDLVKLQNRVKSKYQQLEELTKNQKAATKRNDAETSKKIEKKAKKIEKEVEDITEKATPKPKPKAKAASKKPATPKKEEPVKPKAEKPKPKTKLKRAKTTKYEDLTKVALVGKDKEGNETIIATEEIPTATGKDKFTKDKRTKISDALKRLRERQQKNKLKDEDVEFVFQKSDGTIIEKKKVAKKIRGKRKKEETKPPVIDEEEGLTPEQKKQQEETDEERRDRERQEREDEELQKLSKLEKDEWDRYQKLQKPIEARAKSATAHDPDYAEDVAQVLRLKLLDFVREGKRDKDGNLVGFDAKNLAINAYKDLKSQAKGRTDTPTVDIHYDTGTVDPEFHYDSAVERMRARLKEAKMNENLADQPTELMAALDKRIAELEKKGKDTTALMRLRARAGKDMLPAGDKVLSEMSEEEQLAYLKRIKESKKISEEELKRRKEVEDYIRDRVRDKPLTEKELVALSKKYNINPPAMKDIMDRVTPKPVVTETTSVAERKGAEGKTTRIKTNVKEAKKRAKAMEKPGVDVRIVKKQVETKASRDAIAKLRKKGVAEKDLPPPKERTETWIESTPISRTVESKEGVESEVEKMRGRPVKRKEIWESSLKWSDAQKAQKKIDKSREKTEAKNIRKAAKQYEKEARSVISKRTLDQSKKRVEARTHPKTRQAPPKPKPRNIVGKGPSPKIVKVTRVGDFIVKEAYGGWVVTDIDGKNVKGASNGKAYKTRKGAVTRANQETVKNRKRSPSRKPKRKTAKKATKDVKTPLTDIVRNERGGMTMTLPDAKGIIQLPKKLGQKWTDAVDKSAIWLARKKLVQSFATTSTVDWVLNGIVERYGLSDTYESIEKDYNQNMHRKRMESANIARAIERIDNVFETSTETVFGKAKVSKKYDVMKKLVGKVNPRTGKKYTEEGIRKAMDKRMRQIAEGSITVFDDKYIALSAAIEQFQELESELQDRGLLADHQFHQMTRRERAKALKKIEKLKEQITLISQRNESEANKAKDLAKAEKAWRKEVTRLQIHYKNSGRNYLTHIKDTIKWDEKLLATLSLDRMSNKWKKRRAGWRVRVEDGIVKVRRQAPKNLMKTGHLVSKGIRQEAHDMYLYDLFTNIAKHSEDYVALGDHTPWATDEDNIRISKNIKGEPTNKGKHKETGMSYVRIPAKDKKGFGPLAGMWVQKPIYQELKENFEELSDRQKTWRKIMATWKAGKTVWNPATTARNIGSNMVLAHVLGDTNIFNPKNAKNFFESMLEYRDVKRDLIPQGKYAQEILNDTTIYASDFATAEISDQGSTVIEDMVKKLGEMAPSEGIGTLISKYSDIGPWFYSMMEISMKSTVYKNMRENHGMSIEEAEKKAHDALFDYTKVPPAIRWARQWYSPFITFSYKALPKLAKTAVRKPWKMVPYVAGLYLWEQMVQAMFGETDEEREAENRLLPDYISRDSLPFVMESHARWPFRTPDGRDKYMDLSFYMPWGGATDMGPGVFGWVPSFLAPNNPLFTLGASWLAKEHLFTGEPLYLDTDTGWDKTGKVLLNLYEDIMPAALSIKKMDKILGAVYGHENVMGQPKYSVSDALLDYMLGVKFRNIDYMEQSMWRQKDLQKKIWEIRNDYSSKLRKHMIRNHNDPRSPSMDKLTKEFNSKMEDIMDEFHYRFMMEGERNE